VQNHLNHHKIKALETIEATAIIVMRRRRGKKEPITENYSIPMYPLIGVLMVVVVFYVAFGNLPRQKYRHQAAVDVLDWAEHSITNGVMLITLNENSEIYSANKIRTLYEIEQAARHLKREKKLVGVYMRLHEDALTDRYLEILKILKEAEINNISYYEYR